MLGFMRAMGREDDERAVEYLDTKQPPKRAGQLALELQYVLDTGLSDSLANLSRNPQGDLGGGLPSNRERVGVVKTASGAFDILLERVQQDNGPPVWLFSSDTLKHLPEIYGQLKFPDRTVSPSRIDAEPNPARPPVAMDRIVRCASPAFVPGVVHKPCAHSSSPSLDPSPGPAKGRRSGERDSETVPPLGLSFCPLCLCAP